MPDNFVFGGVDTLDYGAYVFPNSRFQIPEKDIEFEPIPGKLGDVVIGGKRLENEEVSYTVIITPTNGAYGDYSTMEEAFSALRHALLSTNGYATLTDSVDDSHYRKAVFIGADGVKITRDETQAKFELIFSCKPQRFIAMPSIAVPADSAGLVLDTEDFPSDTKNCEPIIEVTGTGSISFQIGDDPTVVQQVFIDQNPGTIIIDSQRKDCYYSGGSANSFVRFSNYQFPAFGPWFENAGQVTISTAGVSLEIDPGVFVL